MWFSIFVEILETKRVYRRPTAMELHQIHLKYPLYLLLLLAPLSIAFAEGSDKKDFDTLPKQLNSATSAVEKSEKGKNCVMVCERWGKDCVINPRTGTKKCRRTCKEMGQECF